MAVQAQLCLDPRAAAVSDVVVVGAGMIGISVANRFLRHTNLSVSVVEAGDQLCAGATGAGQGYIWSGHVNPASEIWPLTRRSKRLWINLVDEIRTSGLDPLETIGWKNTGSLLFASTGEESLALHERLHLLADAGLKVEFWDADAARKSEPALCLAGEGAAGLVHEDAQIDARLAVQYIQECNRSSGGGDRYKEFFGCPVTDLIWSPSERFIQGVETRRGAIHAKRAVIVAAGAWSSGLMCALSKRFDLPLVPPIKPRKGHLLVLENTGQVHLNYGLMEFAYASGHTSEFGVDTTATMDATGKLLLGSSREFKGFDTSPDDDVLSHILRKATTFIPSLAGTLISSVHSRVGLRPYTVGELPIIGPVVEVPGLYIASGHEGQGLMLSLGTAEMVVDMVLESKINVVNSTPFLPAKRLDFAKA